MSIFDEKTNGLFLAPMAGITDAPFRTICIEHGAALTYSEMISAKGLYYKDKKTHKLLAKTQPDEPLAVQIFGSEIVSMEYAAEYISSLHPVLIDINMGCPVSKIFKNAEGCALMKDIKKAYELTACVVKAAKVPVSVKFQSGLDQHNLNYIEFAKAMEAAGAVCITLHPRTRDMFYSGSADWSHIVKVKQAVKIPVIANGDVFSTQDILDIKSYTGCEQVMIARGSLGNPWIFSDNIPDLEERVRVFEKHMNLQIEHSGEKKGVMEMRKHGSWYFKGLPNSAKLRDSIFKAQTKEDVLRCVEDMLGQKPQNTEKK